MRVLVVGDELCDGEDLRVRLQREEDLELLPDICSGSSAIAAILEQAPDLVFLHTQTTDLSAFEVMEQVKEQCPAFFVLIATDEEHASEAFDWNMLDYLVKPIEWERLVVALDRAREVTRAHLAGERGRQLVELLGEYVEAGGELENLQLSRNEPGTSPGQEAVQRLMVREKGRVFFIELSQLRYIRSDGNYLELRTTERTVLARGTMDEILARLDSALFVRIHRGLIVNLEFVREFRPQPAGAYDVVLTDGTKLTLSRSYRDAVLRRAL